MKPNIKKIPTCDKGAKYYASEPSFKEAWKNCHRGDWMLWLAKLVNVDERTLILAKGLCANIVRHLMKDERSIKAVDAAIAYGKGEIYKRRLNVAAVAAYDVTFTSIAYDAPLTPATYAAAAALVASFAAYYAAAVLSPAAYAAYTPAAAYAIAVAAAADTYTPAVARDVDIAEKDIQLKTAEICRGILTDEVMEKMRLI